jgi:hypothetical protein
LPTAAGVPAKVPPGHVPPLLVVALDVDVVVVVDEVDVDIEEDVVVDVLELVELVPPAPTLPLLEPQPPAASAAAASAASAQSAPDRCQNRLSLASVMLPPFPRPAMRPEL